MVFRAVLLVSALVGVAAAADRDFVNSQMFSPDGIRNLTKQRHAAPEAWLYQEKTPEVKAMKPAAPDLCSIPLLEARVRNPDPRSVIPIPKVDFDPIAGHNPAPACKGWNKEKR